MANSDCHKAWCFISMFEAVNGGHYMEEAQECSRQFPSILDGSLGRNGRQHVHVGPTLQTRDPWFGLSLRFMSANASVLMVKAIENYCVWKKGTIYTYLMARHYQLTLVKVWQKTYSSLKRYYEKRCETMIRSRTKLLHRYDCHCLGQSRCAGLCCHM